MTLRPGQLNLAALRDFDHDRPRSCSTGAARARWRGAGRRRGAHRRRDPDLWRQYRLRQLAGRPIAAPIWPNCSAASSSPMPRGPARLMRTATSAA